MGGEVRVRGKDWDESCLLAKEDALTNQMTFIHPFSDETVIKGQATIAKEILNNSVRPDAIICAVGGGGLITGMARYAKAIHPSIKFYGVETLGTHSMANSLTHGKVTSLHSITSIAESIGVKTVSSDNFEYVRELVEEILVTSDSEALVGMAELFREHKLLAEPATTCCLAALGSIEDDLKGKNVVVVISGGNYNSKIMENALENYILNLN